MLAWLGHRLRAALRVLRAWSARHAFSLTVTLLIAAFLTLFFGERLLISMYPGEVGVLWRRFSGTVVDHVYAEGLHLVSPLNIMYRYDVRWQVLRRSVVGLTRDGLEADRRRHPAVPGDPPPGR